MGVSSVLSSTTIRDEDAPAGMIAGWHLLLSARNLPRVKATLSTALNIVDVLEHDTVVLTEAAAGRVAEVLKP